LEKKKKDVIGDVVNDGVMGGLSKGSKKTDCKK